MFNNIEKFIKIGNTRKGIHISLHWKNWSTPFIGFDLYCKCIFIAAGPLMINLFFDHQWD